MGGLPKGSRLPPDDPVELDILWVLDRGVPLGDGEVLVHHLDVDVSGRAWQCVLSLLEALANFPHEVEAVADVDPVS